jgi:glycosyltransferase involved in cell wall biosynthesis
VVTGVPHDRVPGYLNAMDVLAAPSRTTPRWREQLGRMLIEAFACGVPVVASDSGEIPAVVADAGVVLPEADEGRWAADLGAVLGDAGRRAELRGRGLDRAGRYAWPAVAREHLAFFDRLLGGS